MELSKRLAAELVGTFWLTFGGCGAAVFAAKFLDANGANTGLGIGFVGVALAFGLTVLTGVYALGHISGGHFNPAVTVGLVVGRRFEAKEALPYIVAQVVGAAIAAAALWLIKINQHGVTASSLRKGAGAFATNGYGSMSPGNYDLGACLVAEIILTALFLVVIMGATDPKTPVGFAGLAIGLALTLIHLVGIPITNTSVNPARSTGPALFVGGKALKQLWLFWVAPIVGGALGALAYRFIASAPERMPVADEPTV